MLKPIAEATLDLAFAHLRDTIVGCFPTRQGAIPPHWNKLTEPSKREVMGAVARALEDNILWQLQNQEAAASMIGSAFNGGGR